MSFASKILKNVAKKTKTALMDKVGSRLVSGMADTSADAPDAHFVPKRDLYAKMQRGEVDAHGRTNAEAAPEEATPEEAEDQGHSHSHGHSHGHDHDHDH